MHGLMHMCDRHWLAAAAKLPPHSIIECTDFTGQPLHPGGLTQALR